MSRTRAQLVVELRTLVRNAEQLLVVLVIPASLLVFFARVDVVEGVTLDQLAPGILALATMSTAMVGLGIAAGFERSSGVFKRLAMTPLGTHRLILAKALAVTIVLIGQFVILISLGITLGWRPDIRGLPMALAAISLAVLAFAGIGLTAAGRLRPEANLAALNGVYLVLLLTSGFVVPSSTLPGWLETTARALPAANFVDALQAASGVDTRYGVSSWVVLLVWAVVAPAIAARTFRWE